MKTLDEVHTELNDCLARRAAAQARITELQREVQRLTNEIAAEVSAIYTATAAIAGLEEDGRRIRIAQQQARQA